MRPTLITFAERAARAGLFRRGQTVLCACSGGPDSTALLHVLAFLRRSVGHALVAVGIDHGLRPEAAAELALAAETAFELDVPFAVRACEVRPGANLQARARRARHAALQEEARRQGADAIALGHTADDRAETVVMRLLRGSGPRGLAAMPARSVGIEADPAVDLVRPLVAARRADVMAHLARHGLRYARDPSNLDRRFLRSRVRHEVLPLLEALSPSIVEHLCALADQLDPDRDDPLAGLSRAQRRALEEAIHARRSGARVRLPGHELELTFRKGGGAPR